MSDMSFTAQNIDQIDPEKIEPKNGFILIKRYTGEDLTGSDVKMPKASKQDQSIGVIVKMSTDTPLEASEGDEVIFAKYSGKDLMENGENTYVLLPGTLVYAVISNNVDSIN